MTKPTIKVEVIRRGEFSPERAFDAFLNPALAGKFMFATENGKMIRAEIDARVGGGFVFVDERPSGPAEHYGTYLEIVRPKRIAFKFAVQKDSPNSDPVTIDFVPRGKGCELRLTHEVSSDYANYQDRIAQGWHGILEGLVKTLGQA